MSEIDIFVSPTCTIILDHMKKLMHNTFVGNTGHFDNEIDFAAQSLDIKPQRIVIVSTVGHKVIYCITPLALQIRRLKGFFALFPDFKKCGARPPVRR